MRQVGQASRRSTPGARLDPAVQTAQGHRKKRRNNEAALGWMGLEGPKEGGFQTGYFDFDVEESAGLVAS